MPDAVFFDVDGVLLDTIEAKGQAFAEAFDGYPDRRQDIMDLHVRHGGTPRDKKVAMILERVYETLPLEAEVQRIVARFANLVVARVLDCPEIPGASRAILEVAAQCPIHAVSATPTKELRGLLEARGWAQHFRSIEGVPPSKGQTVRQLIHENHYTPSNCFLVGDSSQDRIAAQANAVPFIFVSSGASIAEEGDVAAIPNLVSLPALIQAKRRMVT